MKINAEKDVNTKPKYFLQMLNSIRDCFVTGKWEEGHDAATLLKEDGKERRCKLHTERVT